MIILLAAAWIVVLSLVAGLCAAARAGDLQGGHVSPSAGCGRETPDVAGSTQRLEVYTRANAKPACTAESGAPLLRSGGVAA
jgi:hypothetical protein